MDGINLKATAHVKLTKLDEHGNVVDIEEHEIALSDEEVKALWQSQQPE